MIGSPSGLNFPTQTAKMDHLHYNIRLKSAKCFNFDKDKAKMLYMKFMKLELFKPSRKSFTFLHLFSN